MSINFSTTKNPLVTILVPSYNHADYITDCILSIFKQTYTNFELFVIDDGSIDNSLDVLIKLKKQFNFNLIIQENKGISFTINRCLKDFANGEYFSICASDDFWVKEKLEIQMDFMSKNRFYPMCFGKAFLVDENNNIFKDNLGINHAKFNNLSFEDIFLLKFHPPVSYLFDIKIFKEIGFYDNEVLVEDFYMNLKILSKYPIGFIDKELFYYRVFREDVKVMSLYRRSLSIEKIVSFYKNHYLYPKAVNIIYLQRFFNISNFIIYKKESILLFLKLSLNLKNFKNLLFYKGVLKMLFMFKRIL